MSELIDECLFTDNQTNFLAYGFLNFLMLIILILFE